METTEAVQSLSALAQASRLAIFRMLVAAGPQGLAAGAIGGKLELPPATLSFHLAGLARAGLARSRQDGRFVIYSADFERMNALVGFLTENCCGGASCAPQACSPETTKGETHEKASRTRRRA
jgi:ArsR family transcriptional regulator